MKSEPATVEERLECVLVHLSDADYHVNAMGESAFESCEEEMLVKVQQRLDSLTDTVSKRIELQGARG